jgi:hypothetical protein
VGVDAARNAWHLSKRQWVLPAERATWETGANKRTPHWFPAFCVQQASPANAAFCTIHIPLSLILLILVLRLVSVTYQTAHSTAWLIHSAPLVLALTSIWHHCDHRLDGLHINNHKIIVTSLRAQTVCLVGLSEPLWIWA